MKIKCREITPGCKFEINPKGDWIDLKVAETYCFDAPKMLPNGYIKRDFQMIHFGIAMELPRGYKANLVGRSSLTRKMYLEQNSSGCMDNAYRGNNDEWTMYASAVEPTTIVKGERVAQFEITLSQFATTWQKIKWLFGSRPKFVWVDELSGADRGGFGSTGR